MTFHGMHLKGELFKPMMDTIVEHGPGIRTPTPYQLSITFLDREAEILKDYIHGLQKKWPKYGCTIMCDG